MEHAQKFTHYILKSKTRSTIFFTLLGIKALIEIISFQMLPEDPVLAKKKHDEAGTGGVQFISFKQNPLQQLNFVINIGLIVYCIYHL